MHKLISDHGGWCIGPRALDKQQHLKASALVCWHRPSWCRVLCLYTVFLEQLTLHMQNVEKEYHTLFQYHVVSSKFEFQQMHPLYKNTMMDIFKNSSDHIPVHEQ